MTISRRSSNGVGSKSGRSWEDVFTDADIECNESLGTLTRDASDGALQQYYSMQNGNELNDAEPAVENSTGKKQTLQRVEGETDSAASPLVSAAVLLSEPSIELDIVSESDIEIISSSKDESDTRTSFNAAPKELAEEVSILKGASDEVKVVRDEVLDSDSAGESMETDKLSDEIERCSEVNSAGNFKYSSGLPIQDIDPGNSNITKSDQTVVFDSKIGANENLGHNAGNLNLSDVTDTASESVEYTKANVVDEGGYDREISEDVVVCSTGDNDHSNLKDDGKDFAVMDDDSSKIPENEFTVGNSMSFKPIVDEIPPREMGNVDNVTFEVANLNWKEMSGGLVEKVSTEIDGNAASNKISESEAILITTERRIYR